MFEGERAAARGPAARRYEYLPTFILRGLTALHLEFDLAPSPPRRGPAAGSPTG
ncbi:MULTISPECIES: hypothetical protein [unclassified Parafrankia]|uniref:hypothetical protein n=1 Tax=unclassified Parafrankia TaxID=2994368 RepID=UPI0013597039|nr:MULTISPECIES: hypothetical protein [unclassified Parafrankia]